jgi:hypothetical protein
MSLGNATLVAWLAIKARPVMQARP